MERKHVQVWKESMRKYGKKTWAEVVLKEGKMMKGERREVLEQKMKTLDPDRNEVYKFRGWEQPDKTDVKRVIERVKKEVNKRMEQFVE